MKVCELEGAALDYWVAQCELDKLLDGLQVKAAGPNRWLLVATDDGSTMGLICSGILARVKARRELQLPKDAFYYHPSGDWTYGGLIVDRLPRLRIQRNADGYAVQIFKDENFLIPTYGYGSTILIAAMRCYVASKFGEEVSHPKEGA